MELLKDNPSMNDLIQKLNEVVKNINGSLPSTENELLEVKKLISFGSDTLAGRLNAKLWYFKTQELMTASTELCEGDSCFVLKDGATTGNGTFEYWYVHKTTDVKDIIDFYVDLSNPDLVAVKLQDMTLKDVKDTLSAQISNQSKDLNTKISNLRTDTETALSGKADLINGLIPASQLPSYVDDVIESWLKDEEFPKNAYAKEDTEMTTPITPEGSKIYVNLLNNKTYRWGGNFYVEISKSLAIGETATTAFSGNRGVQLEEKIKCLENYVTPEMFGAVGDGTTDDTNSIKNAINSGYPIVGFKNKVYGVSDSLVFNDVCDLKDIAIIALSNIDYVIKYQKRNTVIENVTIDCNNLAQYGIIGNENAPSDTLYIAKINGCSVSNALIDGFNTGKTRTSITNCFAKKCLNAGFYIEASDTKHDQLIPIDCKYGMFVNSGNTNVQRFHPWSWDKKQIGLHVEADKIVNIDYYFNDTNNIGLEFDGGAKITIHTLANFNNVDAPSAIDTNCRMIKRVGSVTNSPTIFINNIIGSFEGFDDYFLYPDTNIQFFRIDNISLVNCPTRFDGKRFRSFEIFTDTLYQQFLKKFSFSSDLGDITKTTVTYLSANLHGYHLEFNVTLPSVNQYDLKTVTNILEMQYLGMETDKVEYRFSDIQSSFTTHSYHIARKNNANGKQKGCTVRINNDLTLSGYIVLYLSIDIKLY
jgi:hypothetical protein